MSALILALAGGALIGMIVGELDTRASRVARARLILTSASVAAIAIGAVLAVAGVR